MPLDRSFLRIILATFSVLVYSCTDDVLVVTVQDDCLTIDCPSLNNPNILQVKSTEANVQLVQKAYSDHYNQESHRRIEEAFGLPVWNHVGQVIIQEGIAEQYFVPLTLPNVTSSTAVAVVSIYPELGGKDILIIPKSSIGNYPLSQKKYSTGATFPAVFNREALGVIFATIDESAFGFVDEALANHYNNGFYEDLLNKNCRSVEYTVTTCWEIYGGPDRQFLYSDCTWHTELSSVCHRPSGGGGSGGSGGGGGGGSTGSTGGSSGTVSPTPTWEECNDPEADCEPIVVDDNIEVDPSLDPYPCARDVIQNNFITSDNIMTQFIIGVFNANPNVNLTIQAGPLVGQAGTHSAQVSGAGNAFQNFNSTITLNQDRLNCSKDYILATLLHEGLHAFYFAAYINNQGSNTYVPPMFGPLSANEHDQHVSMANLYVHTMASILMEANNILSSSHAQALAWEGLQGTPAWEALSEARRNEIGLISMAARCESPAADNNSYNFKPCE